MHERRVADEHGKGRIHELGRDSGPDHASRWRRPVSSDCCREAGWFGYHAGERYDLWVAAERRLLPALEETPEDALVIADGFSCRGQIRQLGGRRPLHVAQVVQRALRESG